MGVQQLDQKHREPAGSGPPQKPKIFDKFDATGLATAGRALAQWVLPAMAPLVYLKSLGWAFKSQCHILSQAYRSYRSETQLREQILTGAVLFIGLFFAVFGFVGIQSYSKSEARREFEEPAREFRSQLGQSLARHVTVPFVSKAHCCKATPHLLRTRRTVSR